MYWCNDCKQAYPNEDLKIVEISEDEEWTECGHCGCTNIDRADKCRCGEYKNSSEDFCEWCLSDLKGAAVAATEQFKDIFQLDSDWRAKEELKSMLDEIYGE